MLRTLSTNLMAASSDSRLEAWQILSVVYFSHKLYIVSKSIDILFIYCSIDRSVIWI